MSQVNGIALAHIPEEIIFSIAVLARWCSQDLAVETWALPGESFTAGNFCTTDSSLGCTVDHSFVSQGFILLASFRCLTGITCPAV